MSVLYIPDQFETERLLVRIARAGEGAALSEAVRESLPELRPWTIWAQPEPAVDYHEARSRRAQAEFLAREYFSFHLWRRDDSQLVGGVTLNPVDWHIPLFEIGYWLRTSRHGQGYMTEALEGLTQYAFTHLGARRLEIFCDPRNTASAAVAERAGFKLEVRLEHSWRSMSGELVDSLMYVRLAPGEADVRPRDLPMPPDPRLLLDIPEQLETERLLLRAPRPGDGPMIAQAVNDSLDHLSPWMSWADHAPTPEESEQVAHNMLAQFIRREALSYRLIHRSDQRFVGMCALFNFNWDVPSGEIGYWVRSSEQGHGYVTEAVNRLTAFAFDNLYLQRIEIRCDARNVRSAAVAERAGYLLEARLRQHRMAVDGALADTLIFARLRGGD